MLKNFGKKEIAQFGLLIGFVFLGYYMYSSRDINALKRNPNKLPEPLKKLYNDLKQKGYKPVTSPVNHGAMFVTFDVDNIKVLVNEKMNVLFFFDPVKPPYSAQFTNGVLIGKNGIEEDSDLLNAILQTIANKHINE